MVSADNLNLDVLELIFAHLSGNDLSSVALVSRSFLAGVIPRLYNTLSYRLRQGKGYALGQVTSPFAVLRTHPELAIHVRNIEIRYAPPVMPNLSCPHPEFIRECSNAIDICHNLTKFKCTGANILPCFVKSLQGKPRLEGLRVNANLSTDQSKILIQLQKLKTLTLEYASWNVVDVLPVWITSLKQTLTSLTLYMTSELNENTLEAILSELPDLRALHVVGCQRCDHVVVLRLVSYTPLLESLSLTTTESTRPLCLPAPPLHHLRNLAFDTRYSLSPSPSPNVLSTILTHLKSSAPPLTSFTIKLPERKVTIGHPFITQLLEAHSHTLRRLAFLDCGIGLDSINEISKQCVHLERLDVAIPARDILSFTASIARSYSLRVVVDVENHVDHGIRQSLTQDNIRYMMASVRSLRKVVSITDRRVWTGRQNTFNNIIEVTLERKLPHTSGSLWFVSAEA